jgi:two-component system response regulator MtrA
MSAGSTATKTILVCEDDENLRHLIRVMLGDRFRYAEAADGDEALAQMDESKPDLILLDLMLPGRSGFEILERALRAGENRPRVVVISAWSHFDDRALAAGADRFLPKPFEAEELEAAVNELLGGS